MAGTTAIIRFLTSSPLRIVLSVIIALTGILFAYEVYRHYTQPTFLELFPQGFIRVGVDASYPPFAEIVNGELQGIDIDLAHELGQRLGGNVHFVTLGYDGLYDALETGQVDMLISALLIDDFRRADVYYSWSYFNAGTLLISHDSTNSDSMQAVAGKSLAFEFGSTADSLQRIWSRRIPAFDTQPYELPEYALDAVRLGDADFALVDAVSGRLYLRNHPEWQAKAIYIEDTLISIASDIDNRDIYERINRHLLDMINDGTLDEIIDAWL